MTSSQVRESFLNFFRERGHTIVPSAPVVLPADPTLLFANAGMNPFKDIFLGARKPDARRVADTQKCIRVSGKHNDLEEVGHDTYHHTFFEMLGNWSFGDYYKREAIAWAWELLTGVWTLPKNRLWATVYTDDDEAARLWAEVTDIDPAHILRFGEKDNFWEMGETGPCGPCSEIHFDRTPEANAGPDLVNAGSPDVIELWNLVFIQNNRRSDGTIENLPACHVDTGMGFERITSVLQGKASNYDTDLFMPLIVFVAERSGRPYAGDDAVAMRVIADHIRTLAFAIADGVRPSNEGRGYVLRRILRRAVRFGRKLGIEEPFLADLLPILEERMGDTFPELAQHQANIARALQAEEASFAQTLDRGLALFEEAADRAAQRGERVFPGAEAFKLYDTYGFPVDLTRLMAVERGLGLEEAEFEQHMEQQRDRARKARKETGGDGETAAQLAARGLSSEFVGYEKLHVKAHVLALIQDGDLIESACEGATIDVLLDRTPFYGESGGQIGDIGFLENDHARIDISDTGKPAEGLILHRGTIANGTVSVGDTVFATVAAEHRAQIRRHHTATHVLNAALRAEVDPSIHQAGSRVGEDRLRFDFTWTEGLSPKTLEAVEARVNAWILDDRKVSGTHVPMADVKGSDIIALFDEKYGETVRVLEIEGVSRELCGGTHVEHTSQIGLFRIVAESAVASGIRRIEAVCGEPACAWTRRQHRLIRDLTRRFSATEGELPERIEAILAENKRLQKAQRESTAAAALGKADHLWAERRTISGHTVVLGDAGEMDSGGLRKLHDSLREKNPDGIVVLGGRNKGKALFMASAGKPAVENGFHSGTVVNQIAQVTGGGGGGQPHRAQAGGKDADRVAEAIEVAASLVETILSGVGL